MSGERACTLGVECFWGLGVELPPPNTLAEHWASGPSGAWILKVPTLFCLGEASETPLRGRPRLQDTCLPRIPWSFAKNQVLRELSSALGWREQVGRAGGGVVFLPSEQLVASPG